MVDSGNAKNRAGRIPTSLQAVFIASQRGKDVSRAPPESMACRVFFRNWRYQRSSSVERNPNLNPRRLEKEGEENGRRKSTGHIHDAPATTATPAASKGAPAPPSRPTLSPQAYLDAMIRSRGYSTSRFKTLQTAYYNKPTSLQQASYDINLIELVRQGEVAKFRELMSAGISPNPCNQYGESLVHMICRRGAKEFLEILIENGCSLQVADDYGRTPLHDVSKQCSHTVDNFQKLFCRYQDRVF